MRILTCKVNMHNYKILKRIIILYKYDILQGVNGIGM